MKKIISKCFVIILMLCALAYGYYIYWINTDHSQKNNESKTAQNSNRSDLEDVTSTLVVKNNKNSEGNSNNDNQTKSSDIKENQSNTNQSEDNQNRNNTAQVNQTKTNQTENATLNNTTETTDIAKKKLDLYALSALLMDASSDRVLYEKNGTKQMPMASTTKIMTLIVTLENGNLDDIVTVSKYASTMPDVQLGIREGEQYKLGDLVYSLMLESHNDVAVAIAEHVGGSVEGFATLMNAKAKELGCTNTNFVTPNGLDDENHYTTAVDLARIAAYAITNEQFIHITNTPSYTFSDVTGKRSFSVNNKDAFLSLMNGAIGVKTGFTGNAGYCFVGALQRDGKTFISVVLACGWPPNKSYKWHDTKILMNYGLDNYTMCKVNSSPKELGPISVLDGQKGKVTIKAEEKDIELLLRKDETTRVEYDIPDTLTAPVAENELIGKVKYYVNDEIYDEAPIYTTSSVEQIDFEYCFKKIFKVWGLNY